MKLVVDFSDLEPDQKKKLRWPIERLVRLETDRDWNIESAKRRRGIARKLFAKEKILTVRELLSIVNAERRFLQYPGIGKRTIYFIQDKLGAIGFRLN